MNYHQDNFDGLRSLNMGIHNSVISIESDQANVQDLLYGDFNITQPTSLSIIKSQDFKRLFAIHQSGATFLLDSRWNYSRAEHSLGVYFILKTIGASTEEQDFGLIHDLSHGPFSHVWDHVKTLTFDHDAHLLTYFSNVFMPSHCINNLKVQNVNFKNRYPLAKVALPDLNADRIDYTLRDASIQFGLTSDEVKCIINDLCIYEGKIAFRSTNIASQFTSLTRSLNESVWANPLSKRADALLAEVFERALLEGLISPTRIHEYSDEELLELIKFDYDNFLSTFNIDHTLGAYSVKNRSNLDPLVLQESIGMRLSEVVTENQAR